MRRALGLLALVCSFAVLGTVAAQEAVGPASTPRQFLEQLRDAAAPPPAEFAPQQAPELSEEEDFALGKAIQFEAAIIHLASPEDFSDEEQSVTGESVDDLVKAWKANGKVARLSVIRLTSVDNQEGFVTIGEQVPITTARTPLGGGRGGFQSAASYHDVGTLFGIRGRIEEGHIDIECNVEESRLEAVAPSPAPAPSVDAAEDVSRGQAEPERHAIRKVNAETVVSVADGGKVVVSASFEKTPEGSKATIVTLKASILP